MEWEDIEIALMRLVPSFPHAAVDAARAKWDVLGLRFIAELERVADGGSPYLDDDPDDFNALGIYAQYLAAELRDNRAYRPLARMANCTTEVAEERFGDDVGSGLGQILASVCDGDMEPLRTLAENADAGMWCRYAALHAMGVRVVNGDAPRDELLVYLDGFCEREAEVMRNDEWDWDRDPDDLLSWAVDIASTIGPGPLMPKIRGWFAEDLIDRSVTGMDRLDAQAAADPDACIASARENPHLLYIDDAVASMEWWHCFETEAMKPAGEARRAKRMSELLAAHPSFAAVREKLQTNTDIPDMPVAITFRRNAPKVGRNDPCPCGSGKKYKKCCESKAVP